MRDDRGRTESLNGRRTTSESCPKSPGVRPIAPEPGTLTTPPTRPGPPSSAWSSAKRRIATRKSVFCQSPASSTQASTCSGVGSSGHLGITEHIRVVRGQADHRRTPRGRPGGEPQSHLTAHAPTCHLGAEVDPSALRQHSRLRHPGSARSAPAELLRVRPRPRLDRGHHLPAPCRREAPVSGHGHRRVLPSPAGLVDGRSHAHRARHQRPRHGRPRAWRPGGRRDFPRRSRSPVRGEGVRRHQPEGRNPPVHGRGRHLCGQRRRGVVLRLRAKSAASDWRSCTCWRAAASRV